MYTIVCSTNRPDSVSKEVSSIYAEILENKGVKPERIYLEDLPGDFISTALYEHAGQNADFNKLRAVMSKTSKMIFVVPEYNGSFPGVLKAFIDGLEFPKTFTDKKAALVGLSSGMQGAGLALSHLTDIFNYCGTHVLANKPKLYHIDDHLSNGKLSDLYRSLLEQQVDKFIEF